MCIQCSLKLGHSSLAEPSVCCSLITEALEIGQVVVVVHMLERGAKRDPTR